jgi:hypothetical protein
MNPRTYSSITRLCFLTGVIAVLCFDQYPKAIWPAVALLGARVRHIEGEDGANPVEKEPALVRRNEESEVSVSAKAAIKPEQGHKGETPSLSALPTASSNPFTTGTSLTTNERVVLIRSRGGIGKTMMVANEAERRTKRTVFVSYHHEASLKLFTEPEIPSWQKAAEIKKLLSPEYQVKLMPGNIIEITGGPPVSLSKAPDEKQIPTIKLDEWSGEGLVQ